MKNNEIRAAINRLKCGNTAHSCKADYIKLAIKALEYCERMGVSFVDEKET